MSPMVDFWIAIGAEGRGVIALTREGALNGVRGSNVVLGRIGMWSLIGAMASAVFSEPARRAALRPIAFDVERTGCRLPRVYGAGMPMGRGYR